MTACLGYEGFWLAGGSFFYSKLPLHLYATLGVWILTCTSALIYTKVPLLTLAVAWWSFAMYALIFWRYSGEAKTLVWFLYMHSVELTYIAASHLGYFLVLRKRNLIYDYRSS
jgi:hypothetical protein